MAESKPSTPLSLLNQDPRSARYEVDENPAFSPPSSTHMFNIFDSSEIFKKNPRKFDSSSQDDSSVKSATTSTSLAVPTGRKSRSKSLANLGIPSEAEYKKLLDTHNSRMEAPSGATLKPKVEEPATGPRRRISVAVMQQTPGSRAGSGIPAGPPRAATDDDVGGLSKMFRAAFGTGAAGSKPPPSMGYLPEEDEPVESKKPGLGRQPDFPSMSSESAGGTPEMVAVTVTPEPRRLFGFGPQYQPPAETVMVPADQARKISSGGGFAGGGSLLEKVNLAGITAGGITGIDAAGPAAAAAPGRPVRRSILQPPTGEEMNTWAPFST